MRLRIRENKGTGGALSIPGHDMKLGQGGIREIEFFTQTRQLIAGGRDKDLRVRGTVAAKVSIRFMYRAMTTDSPGTVPPATTPSSLTEAIGGSLDWNAARWVTLRLLPSE